jgi:putative molybdopterin biosynthesis protein
VASASPDSVTYGRRPLRRANLVNRMEAVLLEALTAGYDLTEIQQAMEMAMDRWRIMKTEKEEQPSATLRFVGSHDMVMNDLARFFFGQMVPEVHLQLSYNGSLGGLIALAEGKADMVGCHLWDAETKSYNIPFIRRLLPGKETVCVTLAHRRIGLVVAPGNPKNIEGLADLVKPGVRFVNRQSGSGTRVWLDETLLNMGIDAKRIQGFNDERITHSDMARTIAEGNADSGLGLEAAAWAYGLDFIFLNREQYDLLMLPATAQQPAVQQFVAWLGSEQGKNFISSRPGYDSSESGRVQVLHPGD